MRITMYADSTGLFTDEFCDWITNLIEVEVSRECVEKYWREYSEVDEPFEKWLEEYTADNTTELMDFADRYGYECKIADIFMIERR